MTFGPRLLRVVPAMMIAALGAPVETTAQPDWPIDRTAHAMVWHAGLRKIIMIGGVEATRDSAMWAWDGRTWAPIGTGGPVNLAHFAFGYDPRRDRLVVQGGFDAVFRTATPRTNGNTWEWDRRGWRLVSTGGPGVRNHHAMVYDPVRRQMVLFGGSDTTGTMLADTWIWNGATWRSLDVKGPSPRSTHRMVFDSARGVVLMFGGFGQNGLLRDTWEWTGRAWRMVADSGPSARFATRIDRKSVV